MNVWKISKAGSRSGALSTSILSLLMLSAFGGVEAGAANGPDTWAGTSNAFLSAGAWSGTNTPPISGDSLIFGAAGAGGLFLNNNLTSGSFNVAGITFNTGAAAFVIGDGTTTANAGNAFVLTGGITNNSTSLETINAPFSLAATQIFTTTAAGGNLAVSGNISGAGGITAAGGGTLTLSGANTFTGATKVNGGTLALVSGASISGTSSLGVGDTGAGALSLAGGSSITTTGIVRLGDAGGFSGSMTVDGAGSALTVGAYLDIGYAGNSILNIIAGGHVSAATTVALGVLNGVTGTATVSGSGSGSQLSATSTLFLGYLGTGNLTVDSGGIVSAGQFLLGSQSSGAGTLNLNSNGTLRVGGADGIKKGAGLATVNVSDGHIVVTGSDLTTSVPMTFTGTANIHTGGLNATFSGALGGTGGLSKSDTGTLTLTSNESYSGGTTILAGTLQLGTGGATGSIAGNVTNNGTLVFRRNDDFTFGGVISGSGGVVVEGPILRFSAAQTYTGPTTINSAILVLPTTVDQGLSASSVVTLGTNSSLDLSSRAQTVGGLVGVGTVYSFNTSAGSLTVGVAAGQTHNFSGTLGGSLPNFAFGKSGAGTQILSGANTYTGATTINAGTLQLGNGGTTGSLPPGSVITNNGTLAFNRTNTVTQGTDFASMIGGSGSVIQLGSGTLVLNSANTYAGGTTISAGTLQIGSGGTTGSIIGNVTNNGTVIFKRSDDFTFGGVVSGSGGIIQNGNILRLSAAQTYTGPTQINSGILALPTAVDQGLSAFSVVTVATGSILDLSGRAQTIAGLGGGGTVYSDTGTGSLTVGAAAGQTTSFSGTLGGSFPNFAFTKSGNGTQILSGANTYNGGTTIIAGMLQIGAGGTTGSIVGNVATNGALVFNRSNNLTFGWLISGSGSVGQQGSGTLILTDANTYTGSTTISSGTLQLGNNGTSGSLDPNSSITDNGVLAFNRTDTVSQGTDFASVIGGTGSVNQLGSGTLILSGANTYTGPTIISSGTLQLGNNGTSGSLSLSSPITNNSVLAFNRTNAVIQGTDFASVIGGSGSVIQQGSGALVLTGVNTFTGGTIVNGGTLQLGDGVHPASLQGAGGAAGGSGGNAVTLNNGRTLNLLASATIVAGAGGNAINGGNGFDAGGFGDRGGDGGYGTAGGNGGYGVVFSSGGSLSNDGLISGGVAGNGGRGGRGGNGSGVFGDAGFGGSGGFGGNGGTGGNGNTGVVFSSGGPLTNNGTISGGTGGIGGNGGDGGGGAPGGYGDGVPGSGGRGGSGGYGGNGGTGGNGNTGVVFSSGGSLTNNGTISGGTGGIGGNGGNGGGGASGALIGTGGFGGYGGNGGTGGSGVVFSSGGSLTNNGTISGSSGGIGGIGGIQGHGDGYTGYISSGGNAGNGGTGASFTGAAGTLGNQTGGIINGGVSMANFANSVTLETGSKINGALNIGSHTGATLTLTGSGSQIYSGAVTGTTTFAGSLTKSGSGIWTLDQPLGYAGPTVVAGGTLAVNTNIATSSGISVSLSGTLSGHGRVSTMSGAGLIAPGGSQILTGTNVDPSGGLDFSFSITQSGAPTYGNASSSGNDLLHLTATTPFVLALTAADTVTLDFSGATLVAGQTYLGGFFTDTPVSSSMLSGATFVYTGLNGGVVQFDGWVTQASAEFATGTITGGQVMEFKVITVPEPGSAALLVAGAGALLARRRRSV